MEKIVITGGLGYIGSELCKLYSGEARFKKIVVIDKKFVSERVKQLRDWGIEYINASIIDKDAMKQHLGDADVVFHLAGITDVAYTKTQSNEEQDREIRETGIIGTQNVIATVNPKCRIIFPSTHVVYEGFSETRTDITEETPACPVLTYSVGKAQSEKDLAASALDYVILRLGSVYGYSTDTMRMGIMPNLFSKIASQDGTIKLFSGGVQLKSLVPIFDVVRCMKFMAENVQYNREIFHLAKDTATVKEVAELCKKINPKLTLIETKDEIPNLGYTISNQKLLQTGFQFRYDLYACLKEMITNWSVKTINPNLEYIDRGGKAFIDERGSILNYELTEPINLIGYIRSKKGTARANHYHPIQEQKCLLVTGQYISVIQDLSVPNAPVETKIINEGDIAIIKPNVAHTMVFTKDSVFLNLVRGEREHENYGITHTIPYKLVDDALRDRLLGSYRTTCRSCGYGVSGGLERVISLGMSPLANNLKESKDAATELYPLEVNFCPNCTNCQLSVVVPPEKMFDHYLYTSSTAASFRKHFEDAAEKYVREFNLTSDDLVVDIGSNDGVFLKPLKERGVRVQGVEPAKNLAKLAKENGIDTYCGYFDEKAKNFILDYEGGATLVTASNVFAHSDHLQDITHTAFDLLNPDGTFIVEVQYLLRTLEDLTFDNIYHEHTNYWSVSALANFFSGMGYCMYKVEKIDTHGGSIRVYVKSHQTVVDSSVMDAIAEEKGAGLHTIERYHKFAADVARVRQNVRDNIAELKSKFPVIAGYGSPAKATTALNYFGIDCSSIAYTIEDNALKVGKYIPGVDIEIKSKEDALKNPPNLIIVFAWNFFDAIVKNNQALVDKGVKFVNIKDLQNFYGACSCP